MRLTEAQITAIREAVARVYGDAAQAVVFGSRVDDERRGGDGSIKRKLRLLAELEHVLGERRIDVIVEEPGDSRPIVELARRNGEPL